MSNDDDADVPLVISQSPAAGTSVPTSELVALQLSLGANPTGFDPSQTLISQYANSPTLLQMISSMATYFDPTKNLEAFYNNVWDIDNAVGFGLDIWGRIIGVGRLLQIPVVSRNFGFDTGTRPAPYAPFNYGTFYSGPATTRSYALTDAAYRTLLLVRAFGNICKPTASAINQMLQNLFAGRGRCYVQDYGNMQIGYAFEFALTPVEYAILTQAGVPPHPAGVQVIIQHVGAVGHFGFDTGTRPAPYLPFNFGTFYNGL